jgi:K+-sensing histidine kinase KdpD
MADEIMNLVLKLRKKDENRKLLFKTLAHDLKTPASSLKGIMETLTMRKDELSAEQKNELYKMSSMEIDYFSALLDDILFLAKVQDPEFKSTPGETELVSSLRDLCDSISFINKSIQVNFTSNRDEYIIPVEYNSLMRLFRNALDNAFLYGTSKVDVTIAVNDEVKITIYNDGHGFDDKTIQNFGTMKTSRTRTNNQGSLSFGMGAVIMSAIVESIDGSIRPENVYSSENSIIGAKLTIILPLTNHLNS